MSFRPESLRGAPSSGDSGDIDFRLARNSIVKDFQKGRLSRMDVCDAHPELLRAARGVGEPTGMDCPICEESKVVLVSYAFGSGLPSGGTTVTSKKELNKATKRSSDVTCYVVEVCPNCSWNHLAHMLPVGRRRAG